MARDRRHMQQSSMSLRSLSPKNDAKFAESSLSQYQRAALACPKCCVDYDPKELQANIDINPQRGGHNLLFLRVRSHTI